MNLARLGIIALIHVAVLGALYVLSGFGNSAGEGASLAGANGLATWSSQDASAQKQTVGNAAGMPFDSKASDLSGYNARSGTLMAQADTGSSRQRFDPTRPAESSAFEPVSSAPLQPVAPKITPSVSAPGMIEYTVKSGDSLWVISRRFNTTVAEIEASNPGLSASNLQIGKVLKLPRADGSDTEIPAASAPASAPAEFDGSIYVVKGGDVLSTIAGRQGVTVPELKAANGLTSNMIQIGQKLKIPSRSSSGESAPAAVDSNAGGKKISVRPGDSLYKIAAQHDVSVVELVALNKIKDEDSLRIGQVLVLPGKASDTPPAPKKDRPAGANTVSPKPVAPEPVAPVSTPEPAKPLLVDEADVLFDEADIERPVIPIEE